MRKTFETADPVALYVEIGPGQVTVTADEVTQTTVEIDGEDAENATVEHRGQHVAVVVPSKRVGLFGGSSNVLVHVTVPSGSSLATKLGSASLVASGRFGACRIKSGSGDVRLDQVDGEAVVEAGSGDVEVDQALGHLRVKTGSGDVGVERVVESAVVSTGSGDVYLGSTEHTAALRSGSGDLQVKEARSDVSLSTSSGDVSVGSIRRGAVRAKGVSGDVSIGVPAGIPVWTDISCLSGSVRSNLEGAGQPQDGQDFIEIRAKTVSGDINLHQL